MGKIILFYKYINILYPHQIKDWQRGLCLRLGLKGRVLIAEEGINATLGGTDKAIARYIQETTAHPLFADLDIKQSDGAADHFPKLRVVVRPEIVNSGIPKEITADQGGKHLTPAAVQALLDNKPDNLLLLDARNSYESAVGTFKDAVTPPIKNFRDLPGYIDANADVFTGKQVLMFCTGGIRCERASAYLKSKNVTQEVYQIQGGIHRYIEQFPEGHFRGKNYVFDGRVLQKANDDVLGNCHFCQSACDEYANCINAICNLQFIACAPCREERSYSFKSNPALDSTLTGCDCARPDASTRLSMRSFEANDSPVEGFTPEASRRIEGCEGVPMAKKVAECKHPNIFSFPSHELASYALCCSQKCQELVQNSQVPVRTKPTKIDIGSACTI